MQVEVLFFGRPRELAGVAREVVSVEEGARLTDLFEELGERHGDGFANEVRRIEGLIVFINGRDYKQLGGVEMALKEGDAVAVLPVVTGG